MRIIPVIDILKGDVVHGKMGERNKYVPIKSVICKDSDPLNVAKSFKSKFNFKDLYIADLDSIMREKMEFDYINNIAKSTGMRIIMDAGITTVDGSDILFQNGVSIVIIATETLKSFHQLAEIVNEFGPEKIITSIDLYEGKLMAKSAGINKLSPIDVATKIEELGIIETIVLELTRVGSNQGVTLEYIKQIQEKTDLKIITGGGVRIIEDLYNLKKLELSGLLIATAFHNGSIRPEDIKEFYSY